MAVKGPDAFRTISEVARELDVPQHVLRFWESRFTQVHPMKRRGGRRHYRPEDIALLRGIHRLLYVDGFTIKGVQKILRERGIAHVVAAAQNGGIEDHGVEAGNGAAETADGAKIVVLQPHLQTATQAGSTAGDGAADRSADGSGAPQGSAAAGDISGQTQTVLHAALDELGALKDILERARE